jgi:hypothetical protein
LWTVLQLTIFSLHYQIDHNKLMLDSLLAAYISEKTSEKWRRGFSLI